LTFDKLFKASTRIRQTQERATNGMVIFMKKRKVAPSNAGNWKNGQTREKQRLAQKAWGAWKHGTQNKTNKDHESKKYYKSEDFPQIRPCVRD